MTASRVQAVNACSGPDALLDGLDLATFVGLEDPYGVTVE